MTRQRVEALVVAACAYDHDRSKRLGAVTQDLERVESERDFCRGELARLEVTPAATSKPAPLWLRLALDVGIGALAAGTGAAAGIGAPDAVIVGGASLAVSALVARIVVDLLWH